MTNDSSSVRRVIRGIDAISEFTGRCISWLTLAMVLVTFYIVVMRYLFNEGNIAVQESVIYMHACVFLIGAAYTLRHDGHVRVDIFYRPMGERGKAWVNLFGNLFLLMPVMIFFFWISWDYVALAWSIKETSQEAGGIPYRYVLKGTLLLMPVLVILQGIGELLRDLLVIAGKTHLVDEKEAVL
ncbi:TRAP transporter small permease subunit [Pokkaliibacter sp. CJK22405]|uniref:TRAP transporter small permease subunit n=1 Tax=Pokkaliibacter sp. CJK22405 TaxID=3384615 RepID=UPI003985386E